MAGGASSCFRLYNHSHSRQVATWHEKGEARLARAMKKLRYLGWEGYADHHFASALLSDTGLEIEGTNHLSDDAACRMVLATPDAWDIININTPFIRDVLHPAGVIRALPDKYVSDVRSATVPFARFIPAATGADGKLVGIPQRCGPFNLVINQKRLSADFAREQGFSLALDRRFDNRFGILSYADFNVMHVAIAAGLNPFCTFDEAAASKFAQAAQAIFRAARIISTDHELLNRALIRGDIDFYISGGIYTASPARLAGCLDIRAITPNRGPIAGKGGVAFVEINALLLRGEQSLKAQEAFLDFIASDTGAIAASLAGNACNPVVQMYRGSLLECFSSQQLNAMQWDDFEEDMSRCADYEIMPDYHRLLGILRSAAHRATSDRRESATELEIMSEPKP